MKKTKSEKSQDKTKDDAASSDANAIMSFISTLEIIKGELDSYSISSPTLSIESTEEQPRNIEDMPNLVSDEDNQVEISISSESHIRLGRTTEVP